MQYLSSPNWNERPEGASVDWVVLHYTGMQTGSAALERLMDPAAEVSAHYLIEENGTVTALVPEEKRAWHAGVSFWQGQVNLNHSSIGIELVNPGHEYGYRPFPADQVDSLLALLKSIKARWNLPQNAFIGHSDIAPYRKTDPGELFPWDLLAGAGFGVISHCDQVDLTVLLEKGSQGPDVLGLMAKLARVGYDCDGIDTLDDRGEIIIQAFQRHWRQKAITGKYDRGTALVLADIAEKM